MGPEKRTPKPSRSKKRDAPKEKPTQPRRMRHHRAEQRALAFINAARVPDDLRVLPQDVPVVDEEAAHGGDIPHHVHVEKIIDLEQAEKILRARLDFDLVNGFRNPRDLKEIARPFIDLLIRRFGPAHYGSWDFWYDMTADGQQLSIEHAALLRTGEVIFLESGTDTILWNPKNAVSPEFTVIPGSTTGLTADLFCSGHVFLSDGRLLVVGGGGGGPGAASSIQGWRFDPIAHTWTRTGDMTTKRWYPTAVMLGDEQGPTGASNRVLVAGGSGGTGGMEVYSEATNSFLPITVDGPVTKHFAQTYPGMHLLPGGEIFYSPTGFANCSTGSPGGYADGPAAWFTFDSPTGATKGHWTEVAGGTIDRAKGMAALVLQPTYPFVRVVVVGGGPAGTNSTAQTINLSSLSPTWGPPTAIPDGRPRINVNTVLLPDSTVLVCGGLQAAPYPTWIYNPNAVISPWRAMDEMNRPRHYHSCALLLPSGKVAVAGGASPGGCSLSVENSVEVFSPPYLFNPDGTPAARPAIDTVNGEVPTPSHAPQFHHGQTFKIETQQAASIAKVVLIRPMAVTHQTDSEQRIVHLAFYESGTCELTATAPDGGHPHAMAPRGYYMLFLLDGKGVPSEGKFVHLH